MANRTNAGTRLIEEGALLPESVRFGSEPWTVFYRAGEIIRELRKASGKQSKYGSEVDTYEVVNSTFHKIAAAVAA